MEKKYKTLTKEQWQRAEKDFTEGWLDENDKLYYPTLNDLHKKYKVSLASLKRKYNKLNWEQIKDSFMSERDRIADENKRQEYLSRIRSFDSDFLTISESVRTIVLSKLYRQDQLNIRIDPKVLASLTQTAKIAHELGVNVISNSDDVQESSIDKLVRLFAATLTTREYGTV